MVNDATIFNSYRYKQFIDEFIFKCGDNSIQDTEFERKRNLIPESTSNEEEDNNRQLFWLLAIQESESFYKFNGIDLKTFATTTINSSFKPSIICAVSENYWCDFALLLYDSYPYTINNIKFTDLYLTIHASPLLDVVFNVNHSEKEYCYPLVIIECTSLIARNILLRFIEDNKIRRNFFYVSANQSPHFIIMINTLLNHYTRWVESMQHINSKRRNDNVILNVERVFVDKITMLKEIGCDNGQEIYIDNIFTPNGLYSITSGNLQLISNKNLSNLYLLLPVISIDIETITDNLTDLPLGINEHEQISSLVLFCRYLDSILIYAVYQSIPLLFDNSNMTFDEIKFQNDKIWKDTDKKLAMYFQKRYSDKYPNYQVRVIVKSFVDEEALLNNFLTYYSGYIFNNFNLPSDSYHILTGYNIYNYDLPTIYNRLLWYQSFDKCANSHIFEIKGQKNACPSFNNRAIVIDMYLLFGSNHLFTGGRSLKEVSKSLIKHNTKIDLNAVAIRIPYMYEKYLKKKLNATSNTYGNDDLIAKTFIDFLKKFIEVPEHENLIDNNLLDETSSVFIDILSFPNDLKTKITNSTIVNKIQLPKLFTTIHYNICDCECILTLQDFIGLFPLLNDLMCKFPNNIENCVQDNITNRMNSFFSIEAMKCLQLYCLSGSERNSDSYELFIESPISKSLVRSLYPKTCEQQKDSDADNVEDEDDSIDDISTVDAATIQAFKNIFIQTSISINTTMYTTRAAYKGAVTGNKSGIYELNYNLDATSLYPTIESDGKLYVDSTDFITVGALKKICDSNKHLYFIFETLIKNSDLKIMLCEDVDFNKVQLLDIEMLNTNIVRQKKKIINVDYMNEFLNNYKIDYEFKSNMNFVGQLITSLEQLSRIPPKLGLIIVSRDSNSFLPRLINKIKEKRSKIKSELKKNIDDDKRKKFNGEQQSLKIIINSLYGLFANSNIPVAASTTLYGRKIIICSIKYFFSLYLYTCCCLQNMFEKEYLNSYENFMNDSSKNNGIIPDEIMNKYKLYNYPNSSLEILHSLKRMNDLNICLTPYYEYFKMMMLRAQCDGYDDIEKFKDAIATIKNSTLNLHTFVNINLPKKCHDIIVDFDTDGFQISNIAKLSTTYLRQTFNENVRQTFNMPNLNFESKHNLILISMKKKKYCQLLSGIVIENNIESYEFYKNNHNPVKLEEMKIAHSGYERNAVPIIKYICDIIAAKTFLNYRFKFFKVPFSYILEGIYTYLHSRNDPYDLFINITLKNIKPNSSRKRFIDEHATNYTGTLKSVYIVNELNFEDEVLMLHDDYLRSKDMKKLHYAFFLRQYIKVWFTQLQHTGVFLNSNNTTVSDLTTNSNETNLQKYQLKVFKEWLCLIESNNEKLKENIIFKDLTSRSLSIL